MDKICAFFGHRTIGDKGELKEKVSVLVEELIQKGFTVFLFGGFGEFDELCYDVVSGLKEKYSTIKRVYCLHDERYLRERKRPKYLRTKAYEEFVYFPLEFDYWYTRIYYRNCEMVDKSDYLVFYAESRKDSGAYKTLQYAMKRKKEYINLFS